MTLSWDGELRDLITDVDRHRPERLAPRINHDWAQDAAARAREYLGGGPMTRYLTARSGRARASVRATSNAQGAQLTATAAGLNLLEDGGTIQARPGGWLTFRLSQPWDRDTPTGRWVRTRQVRIPARHMIRDAGDQAADRLPDFLDFALEAP